MLALLRTPRWIGFSILVIVAIIGFGILSAWQWSRAEEKRAERQELALVTAAQPTSIASADRPWQMVEIQGTFDNATTRFVRQRPLQGHNGYWVMTLLNTTDAGSIWVNRGWTPAGPDARVIPDVPAAPTGLVALVGAWVPEEPPGVGNEALPTGMIARVASENLPVRALTAGFVHVAQMTPAEDAFLPITPPDVNEGQNLSYAMQWLAFAIVASAGWWLMLRREARDHVS